MSGSTPDNDIPLQVPDTDNHVQTTTSVRKAFVNTFKGFRRSDKPHSDAAAGAKAAVSRLSGTSSRPPTRQKAPTANRVSRAVSEQDGVDAGFVSAESLTGRGDGADKRNTIETVGAETNSTAESGIMRPIGNSDPNSVRVQVPKHPSTSTQPRNNEPDLGADNDDSDSISHENQIAEWRRRYNDLRDDRNKLFESKNSWKKQAEYARDNLASVQSELFLAREAHRPDTEETLRIAEVEAKKRKTGH